MQYCLITALNHCVESVRIRSYSGPHFPAFGLILRISPYSVQMWENTDQNNCKYGHFLRSEYILLKLQKSGLLSTLAVMKMTLLWKTLVLS